MFRADFAICFGIFGGLNVFSMTDLLFTIS